GEARVLEERGFKRLLLVLGEDKRWGLEYIIDSIKAIYAETGIRIVHVNAPPMEEGELRELKGAGGGVGLYQAFQETYHRPTYEEFHPSGNKRDYVKRLGVMDSALRAGFGDVGIGSLLGLYDFRFDVLATIAHSYYLYQNYGTHAHTISIPRLRPAKGSALKEAPYPVSDLELKLIVAVYRLSVPTAGVVATTRESAGLREELTGGGVSQLSAASRTDPGGYGGRSDGERGLEQFSTSDNRSLEDVMASIAKSGAVPSLCTACYRVGRTGESFTEKTGAEEMLDYCEANALLTLKEYLLDSRANGTGELFEGTVEKALAGIKEPAIKEKVVLMMKEMEEGKRDLFF
ncbi:MAG: [FeFe] hydrogenase H-cluster radical SAM maturase HydG, partial [Thermodesulfobacteriota bacterium]